MESTDRGHPCGGEPPFSTTPAVILAVADNSAFLVMQMQSMAKQSPGGSARPEKLTIMNTLSYIYKESGIKGLYRGVTPRVCLGVWQTVSNSNVISPFPSLSMLKMFSQPHRCAFVDLHGLFCRLVSPVTMSVLFTRSRSLMLFTLLHSAASRSSSQGASKGTIGLG